jgi:Protein DA1
VSGVFALDSCPVCGRPLTVRRGVALTGEQFCDRHLGLKPCALCAMPADVPGLAIPLCRRCAATSISTSADVRRELPTVKRQLAALGIRTITPVKVQLASAELLHGIVGDHALGVTVSRETSVVDLYILQDLPLLKFGTTVAHEVMHTYMTQNGFGDVSPRIAEGLCQLLAYAWIIRQDGILAEAERRQIAENTDSIYGDGFRQAYAAVRRVGVRRTLATVKREHRLP